MADSDEKRFSLRPEELERAFKSNNWWGGKLEPWWNIACAMEDFESDSNSEEDDDDGISNHVYLTVRIPYALMKTWPEIYCNVLGDLTNDLIAEEHGRWTVEQVHWEDYENPGFLFVGNKESDPKSEDNLMLTFRLRAHRISQEMADENHKQYLQTMALLTPKAD